MRQKYDHGEDPLDPEQKNGGGNPFNGGPFPFHGHPFGGGGGGFQFKFHFKKGYLSFINQLKTI